MKTLTSRPKFTEPYCSALLLHTPRLPRDFREIRHRASEIYAARGGTTGVTLNDWLKAELELKQGLGKQTDLADNGETSTETTDLDLTVDICGEDGSLTRFYQDDKESLGKTLRQLVAPRLFNQPLLTLASQHSVSAIPSRTIDLILAHTTSPLLPLPLPRGCLDAVEVNGEAFPGVAQPQESTAANDQRMFLVEIHPLGDWMVRVRLQVTMPETFQEQRQVWNHLLDLPVIAFRLKAGGMGFVNPANVSRVTVYSPFKDIAEPALTGDLLPSVSA